MHYFHIDNNKGDPVIGYDMIIGIDMMVQIGLTAAFKDQLLQWDGSVLPMKEQSILIGQKRFSNYQYAQGENTDCINSPPPKATEIMINNIVITYTKVDLEQVVANETHIIPTKKMNC